MKVIAILILLFSGVVGAFGHAVGENYVFLSISKAGEVEGHFEFHINDLREKLKLDIGEVDEGLLDRVNGTSERVHEYILKNFSMAGDEKPISFEFTKPALFEEDAVFIQYHFVGSVEEIPNVLSFKHEMMYEDDRFHRGMLVLGYNPVTDTTYGEEKVALIFERSEDEHLLDLREPIPDLLTPLAFIWQGVLHIWIGIDHILFLVVLLLPTVLRRDGGNWVPVDSFKKALFRILKIVTIFTVAHTITLALAALDIISLPGAVVESVIALSILLVALNNVFPTFKEGSTFVIFGLGLFHGMGFASVLGDIPFRIPDLKKILVAFNVGVELGQVAIVLVACAVLFGLRKWGGYKRFILHGGSILAGAVALYWFVERAFGL